MTDWPTIPPPNTQPLIANRYRLGNTMGSGSFGEVFKAEDTKFSPPRPVAIKVVHSELLLDPAAIAELKHEASVMSGFVHPNILRVLDFDIALDMAYVVTELASGGSLADRLRPAPDRPPVPIEVNLMVVYLRQIAEALDAAHSRGLIHRDIKPSNILLDQRDRPLLSDFGLAVNKGSTAQNSDEAYGTPLYAAPEQWNNKASTASDIYSLAVTLFELVTGRTPYEGDSTTLKDLHFNAPVPLASSLATGPIPSGIDEILARAMSKDPAARPASAEELYQGFKAGLNSTPAQPPQTHKSWWSRLFRPNQP